jgi:hypothetical protein
VYGTELITKDEKMFKTLTYSCAFLQNILVTVKRKYNSPHTFVTTADLSLPA